MGMKLWAADFQSKLSIAQSKQMIRPSSSLDQDGQAALGAPQWKPAARLLLVGSTDAGSGTARPFPLWRQRAARVRRPSIII